MKTKPPSSSDPLPVPKKRTSLKDLATYLGVSQTTVSFVLNDAPLAKNLTEETRRRVHEAARKFNYRPSYFALNLHKTGSDSVGVIVPEHSEGYFTVVMEGVERYLLQKHFLYFTACHYGKHKLVKEYSELLMNRGAEGLLLLNTNADFDTPLPVVTISGHMEKEGVTNVFIDHRAAARLAIRHLYDLGHRKIAFMKGHRSVMDTDFRWEAMMQVARDFGVEPTPSAPSNSRSAAGPRRSATSPLSACSPPPATSPPSSASTIPPPSAPCASCMKLACAYPTTSPSLASTTSFQLNFMCRV